MSESAREGSGGEKGGGKEGAKGVRSMADVARLFLDGARELPGNGTAAKRVGPKERGNEMAKKEVGVAAGNSGSMAKKGARGALPKVLFGMCGGSGGVEKQWKLLCGAAAGLAAEHSTTVCVIGERKGAGELVMEILGSESEEDVPRLAPGAGTADVQVGRAMYTLRDSVGAWLIAAPEAACEAFGKGLERIGDWLVVSPMTNEGVVGSYQQMKRALAAAVPGRAMRAFIVGEDEAEAGRVHGRLEQAAREFLKRELVLAGVGPASEGGAKAAGIYMSQEEREGVWAALLDELCSTEVEEEEVGEMDVEAALEKVSAASEAVEAKSEFVVAASQVVFDHLSHVLDPEEREALSAELEEVGEGGKEFDIRREVQSPGVEVEEAALPVKAPAAVERVEAVKKVERMAESAEAVKGGEGLRVFDLPQERRGTRGLEWDAVEGSIGELVPGSIVLEARPPMSWATESCVAIDGARGGKLHVWTLYKNGVSWYGLREWATEHRRILGLTRRDLVMDERAEVAVHIVMPLEGEGAGTVRDLLRTPSENVFVYRIRAVAWGARRGMVVVPMV